MNIHNFIHFLIIIVLELINQTYGFYNSLTELVIISILSELICFVHREDNLTT